METITKETKTPRTDAAAFDLENYSGRRVKGEEGTFVDSDFARELELELNELKKRFTRLDQPKYTGSPMLDAVLGTVNPEFRAWVDSLPATYWARYDLSAARVGWEAAMQKSVSEEDKEKWMHTYGSVDLTGETPRTDAAWEKLCCSGMSWYRIAEEMKKLCRKLEAGK